MLFQFGRRFSCRPYCTRLEIHSKTVSYSHSPFISVVRVRSFLVKFYFFYEDLDFWLLLLVYSIYNMPGACRSCVMDTSVIDARQRFCLYNCTRKLRSVFSPRSSVRSLLCSSSFVLHSMRTPFLLYIGQSVCGDRGNGGPTTAHEEAFRYPIGKAVGGGHQEPNGRLGTLATIFQLL